MTTLLARSHVLDRDGGVDPCTTICDVRAITVCNTIADADLARLATIAVVTEVPAGQCFVDEGEPATCFFVVTAGTAKLFKLLPDGRRQIIAFVGPGHFLALAVSDTYTFSAEAIEPVRYCRFQRAKLRALLDDFPLMEKRLLEVAYNRTGGGAGTDASAATQEGTRAAGVLTTDAEPPRYAGRPVKPEFSDADDTH